MAIDMKNRDKNIEFAEYIKKNSYKLGGLSKDAWFVGNVAEQNLNVKIVKTGKQLKEWKIKIYFGIKTGLNEAFVVDKENYECLVEADKNNKKILKPILRGRDIEKYGYKFSDIYLILTEFDLNIPKLYPKIYKYLMKFETEAIKRADQGKNWWNLRSCDYYSEFDKEKVIWKRIGSILRFGYDADGVYGQDSTCIMTGENLKFLCAYMNSKLGQMLLFDKAPKTGTGDLIVSVQALEPLLVPPITTKNQSIVDKIEKTVDNIIVSKRVKPNASISDLETEIDKLVYQMYDLNDAEIEIIENKMEQNVRTLNTD
jgi:hypothetical protein